MFQIFCERVIGKALGGSLNCIASTWCCQLYYQFCILAVQFFFSSINWWQKEKHPQTEVSLRSVWGKTEATGQQGSKPCWHWQIPVFLVANARMFLGVKTYCLVALGATAFCWVEKQWAYLQVRSTSANSFGLMDGLSFNVLSSVKFTSKEERGRTI